MYRVSPFTYLVEGILTVAVANTPVICGPEEYVHVQPSPSGSSCYDYLGPYLSLAGGYLQNPNATSDCAFCSIDSTNTFLGEFALNYDNRWRDFGIMWVYVVVNVLAAVAFYWLIRVVSEPTLIRPNPNTFFSLIICSFCTGC